MEKHIYDLDEIDRYMTKVELGGYPTFREIDTIGNYVEELKGELHEEEESKE